MTNEELKSAVKRQTYVMYQGKKYFLQGVLAQWINGRLTSSAILLDVGTVSNTILQVKPETIEEIR